MALGSSEGCPGHSDPPETPLDEPRPCPALPCPAPWMEDASRRPAGWQAVISGHHSTRTDLVGEDQAARGGKIQDQPTSLIYQAKRLFRQNGLVLIMSIL